MTKKIHIRVHGCVAHQGGLDVFVGTTVGQAVKLAGGFGGQGMQPAGPIQVRSRRGRDGKYYLRRRLNYRRHPEHLCVELRADDLVVIQFDVDTWTGKVKSA